MAKQPFQKRAIPPSLADLPRFGITSTQTSSRAQKERTDVAFGVRSLDDLANELRRGFANPDRPKPSPRAAPKKR